MKAKIRFWQRVFAACGLCTLVGASIVFIPAPLRAFGGWHLPWCRDHHACAAPFAGCGEEPPGDEIGGAWYWLRSPEEEKRLKDAAFKDRLAGAIFDSVKKFHDKYVQARSR